jgi:hypothetical protein
MHCDRSLDNHVGVLLSGFELLKIGVESVEAHFDPSATRQFLTLGTAAGRCLAKSVILSSNLVFVGLNELSNHVPKQMHLVAG